MPSQIAVGDGQYSLVYISVQAAVPKRPAPAEDAAQVGGAFVAGTAVETASLRVLPHQ